MTLRFNLSPNWFRVAVICLFFLTVWFGILVGNYLEPIYFLGFVGGFWASLGVLIHFGWLKVALRCKACMGMASIESQYRQGPAGRKVYPVLVCPHCKSAEII